MKKNIPSEKLREKIVQLYKFKLYLVKAVFFIAVFLFGYFLFADFSETSETETKTLEKIDTGSIKYEVPEISGQAAIQDDGNNYNIKEEIIKIINETANGIENDPESDIHKKNEVKEEKVFQGEQNNKFSIAVIIDDMGISQERTKDIIKIKAPLTSSFLTYGQNLEELTEDARKSGHEVIIHIPMEPYSAANTAPGQLLVSMSNKEIKATLNSFLDKIKNLHGGNNHMGSKFTENREKMSAVMEVLKKRKMFFLDSKTSSKAIGCEIAEKYGVECANRDVFLDNENDFDYITKQLHQTEEIAQKKGYAIAIGHPKTKTIEALDTWLNKLDSNRFEVIHLGDLLKKIKKMQKNS